MNQRFELTGHHRRQKSPSADLVSAFQQTTSAEEVVAFLRLDRVRHRSFATLICENWRRHFDASQMSIVFFEDIVKSPEEVMKRLREDFGLSGTLRGNGRAPVDFNRKADELKREMNDEVRALLVDTFRDEMLRCAEVFGGAAEHWPVRYGIA